MIFDDPKHPPIPKTGQKGEMDCYHYHGFLAFISPFSSSILVKSFAFPVNPLGPCYWPSQRVKKLTLPFSLLLSVFVLAFRCRIGGSGSDLARRLRKDTGNKDLMTIFESGDEGKSLWQKSWSGRRNN